MRSLTDQLANYAAYHRDRRNIATHFIGVPMIVFAVSVLLSRPAFEVAGLTLSAAWIVAAAATIFYLALSLPYGIVMGALLALSSWGGAAVAELSTALWLATGVGLFFVGWLIQFIGHYFEGRKPAFVDDLVGLLIGPLFIVTEAAFLLGASRGLQQAIEARVGPTRSGPGGTQTA